MKPQKIFILLLLICPGAAAERWKTDFSGHVQLNQQRFTESVETDGIKQDNQIYELKLNSEIKYNKDLQLQLNPYFRAKPTSEFDREQGFFDLNEGYLEYRRSDFKFRLGTNVYNWGILDIYSPLDVVNQRTYFDPLDTQKMGAAGLDITYSANDWSAQFLVLSRRRPAALPAEDSRWLPREIVVNSYGQEATIILPDEVFYSYGSEIVNNDALDGNFGLKVSYTWDDFDFNFVHFTGLATNPSFLFASQFTLTNTNVTPNEITASPDVTLFPVYNLTHTSGFNVVWANEYFITRYEFAYVHQDEVEGDSQFVNTWSQQNGLGLERQFQMFGYSWTALLQYYYSKHKRDADNFSGSAFRIFDDTIVASLVWALNDRQAVILGTTYDVDSESNLTLMRYNFALTDQLKGELKYYAINGPDETLLGAFKNNDYAQLGISFYF